MLINKLMCNMQEYIESVFYLKTQGKECLCPIDNPIVQDLINDEILYRHYKRGDTSVIQIRIEESLNHFCNELYNQATGNLLYDLTKDLDIPAEDED